MARQTALLLLGCVLVTLVAAQTSTSTAHIDDWYSPSITELDENGQVVSDGKYGIPGATCYRKEPMMMNPGDWRRGDCWGIVEPPPKDNQCDFSYSNGHLCGRGYDKDAWFNDVLVGSGSPDDKKFHFDDTENPCRCQEGLCMCPLSPTPSALTPSTLTPSTLTPSTLTPSTLTPSTLTPSTLTPSTLTPSTLTPSTLTPSTLTPSTLTPSTLTPTPTPVNGFPPTPPSSTPSPPSVTPTPPLFCPNCVNPCADNGDCGPGLACIPTTPETSCAECGLAGLIVCPGVEGGNCTFGLAPCFVEPFISICKVPGGSACANDDDCCSGVCCDGLCARAYNGLPTAGDTCCSGF